MIRPLPLAFYLKGRLSGCGLDSHILFIKSFCKSQFPHKFVNIFFILVKVKDALTDLWGSWPLQNDFRNTLGEIRASPRCRLSSTLHHQPDP